MIDLDAIRCNQRWAAERHRTAGVLNRALPERELVAHDVPQLIAEVERLRRQIDALTEMLVARESR